MLRHADALVCPLPRHCLARNSPHALLLISPAAPTIRTAFPPRFAALPKLCSDPSCRSNPIAHRVRRKRQRLPPSLLIENASDRDPAPPQAVCPEAFPIKASDHSNPIASVRRKRQRLPSVSLSKTPRSKSSPPALRRGVSDQGLVQHRQNCSEASRLLQTSSHGANHCASPSIPMNFFRYIIDGHEAQKRQRVLSCP